jgi:hypothetical protein
MTAGPDITSLADLRAKANKLDQRQAALRPGIALVERPDGNHRQVWAWPGTKQTPKPLAAHPRTIDRLPAMTDTTITLRPRVTMLPDGTFRPEVVIDDGGQGDVRFGELCATADEARRWALQACESGNSGPTA